MSNKPYLQYFFEYPYREGYVRDIDPETGECVYIPEKDLIEYVQGLLAIGAFKYCLNPQK